MVMSSKKIGKMVTADVDKALANIGSTRPDMKADATVSAAAAPSRDLSFAERFKYARMAAKAAGLDPSKQTFTHNGKTYTTRMAGEGASRPAATTRSGTGSSGSPVGDFYLNQNPNVRGNAASIRGVSAAESAAAQAKAGKSNVAAKAAEARKTPVNAGRSKGFLAGMFSGDAAANYAKSQEKKYGKPVASGSSTAAKPDAAKAARLANLKRAAEEPGASRYAKDRYKFATESGMYAKGGKIDGCAIRGKTRAIKKGK